MIEPFFFLFSFLGLNNILVASTLYYEWHRGKLPLESPGVEFGVPEAA